MSKGMSVWNLEELKLFTLGRFYGKKQNKTRLCPRTRQWIRPYVTASVPSDVKTEGPSSVGGRNRRAHRPWYPCVVGRVGET